MFSDPVWRNSRGGNFDTRVYCILGMNGLIPMVALSSDLVSTGSHLLCAEPLSFCVSPQKPHVPPPWSAALGGPLTWRRTTTRRWCATMSTARTVRGCTCSASMSGRAASWSSSTASAVHAAGTRSSAARICGPRRATTWPFASAPAAVDRVTWRRTQTGIRWSGCRMRKRRNQGQRRTQGGPWARQWRTPPPQKSAGHWTSPRKAWITTCPAGTPWTGRTPRRRRSAPRRTGHAPPVAPPASRRPLATPSSPRPTSAAPAPPDTSENS